MSVRILTSAEDLAHYDHWVTAHPEGSLWLSLAWRDLQKALGREVRVYVAEDGSQIKASALVIIDTTTMGLKTWEIPRGPIGKLEKEELRMKNELLEKIIADAKKGKTISLYFSPTKPILNSSFLPVHFSHSRRHVHPEATRVLDLTMSDGELLLNMKPKGRYNIRLAQKHGIVIEPSDDCRTYAALAEETARRDGFKGHSGAFYEAFLAHLPRSFLLLARIDEKPIAGLLGVIWGTRGIYYYGASNARRELMAPYLLQWETMKYCRSHGCTHYDLFGVAPEGSVNHPWSGVTDFKAKFGGQYIEYPPEQEIVLRPLVKAALRVKHRVLG